MEKINKLLGLALIGFDENQKKTFLAILSLAERRLHHSWHIVESERADFFLLLTEKSQSELLITEKKLPRERCLFCSDKNRLEKNELCVDAGKIPRLASLIEVFNQIAAEKISSDNDNNFFVPEQSLLKYLLPNATERLLWSFNSYKLYVDPVGKVYYCATGLKNLGVCLGIADAIAITVVSSTDWDNMLELATLPVRPLNNLIWYIAFKSSNGRLLRGHSSQDSVYLTRWPDLGIQDCGQYVKLAAFMRNNAVCLTEIADKTATPLTEVYNFYNACYLIGIVEKTAQPELYAKNLDKDKQQLLVKITHRLKEINSSERG